MGEHPSPVVPGWAVVKADWSCLGPEISDESSAATFEASAGRPQEGSTDSCVITTSHTSTSVTSTPNAERTPSGENKSMQAAELDCTSKKQAAGAAVTGT